MSHTWHQRQFSFFFLRISARNRPQPATKGETKVKVDISRDDGKKRRPPRRDLRTPVRDTHGRTPWRGGGRAKTSCPFFAAAIASRSTAEDRQFVPLAIAREKSCEDSASGAHARPRRARPSHITARRGGQRPALSFRGYTTRTLCPSQLVPQRKIWSNRWKFESLSHAKN